MLNYQVIQANIPFRNIISRKIKSEHYITAIEILIAVKRGINVNPICKVSFTVKFESNDILN